MRLFLLITIYLFRYSCFCQDSTARFITESKAILIAKKHGLTSQLIIREWSGMEGVNTRLDTAGSVWEITYSKLTYKDWGKTTKRYKIDHCWRCRHGNGCYVVRTRTIFINAISGKVIKKVKSKQVALSLE